MTTPVQPPNPSEVADLRMTSQYLWLLAPLKRLLDEHGYAMGVHGTMIRDLDVIACPWKEVVSSPAVLAQAVMDRFGGYIADWNVATTPRVKPHGRLAWPIHLCGSYYIDLSVMPVASSSTIPLDSSPQI